MLTSPFAKLIEILAEARLREFKRELAKLYNFNQDIQIDLQGLWRTRYGHDVLQAQSLGRDFIQHDTFNIRYDGALKEFASQLGIEVSYLGKVVQQLEVSDRMLRLVDAVRKTFVAEKNDSSYLYDVGFLVPQKIVESCLQNITKRTYQSEWAASGRETRERTVYDLEPIFFEERIIPYGLLENHFIEGVCKIVESNTEKNASLVCKVIRYMPHIDEPPKAHRFHNMIFSALNDELNEEYIEAISSFFRRMPFIHYLRFDHPYLDGTSQRVFEKAMKILLEHNRGEIVGKLWEMAESYHEGGLELSVDIAGPLVALLGMEAAPKLLKYLTYYGRGESYRNIEVFNALASLGEEIVPLLRNKIAPWGDYVDVHVANLLLQIGGSGLDLLSEAVCAIGHEPTEDNSIIRTLFSEKHPDAMKSLLSVVYELSHDDDGRSETDEEVKEFIESLPPDYPYPDAASYLQDESDRIRCGSWVILQFKKEDSIRSAIEEALKTVVWGPTVLSAVRTASLFDSKIILQEFFRILKEHVIEYSLWDDILRITAEYIMNRDDGISMIRSMTESSEVEDRVSAFFIIGYLSSDSKWISLLYEEDFTRFVDEGREIYKNEENTTDDAEVWRSRAFALTNKHEGSIPP